jgi:hypothetical protein
VTTVQTTAPAAPATTSGTNTGQPFEREPALALLTAAVGLVLLVVGNVISSTSNGAGENTSHYGQLFPLWTAQTWDALPYVLLPLAVIGGSLLAWQPRLRPAAAGLLFGLGIQGYLISVPFLALYLSFGTPGPPLAWIATILGSLLVATGGALLYARSEDTATPAVEHQTGIGLVASFVSLAGALAVVVSAFLPVYDLGDGVTVSFFQFEGAGRWLALAPIALAVVTATIVLFLARGRSALASGATLLGLGALGTVYSLGLLGATGAGEFSPKAGAIVGFVAAAVIAIGGAIELAVAPTRRAPDGDSASDELENAVDVDPGSRETTRHLAATAQLDHSFARWVVRDVVNEPHRAVAPSFGGIDLAPVIKHCISARGRKAALALLVTGLAFPLVLAVANLDNGLLVVLVIVLATWAAVFAERWVARYRIAARHLGSSSYDPEHGTRYLPPGSAHRIREIVSAESRNLVVYGGYSPHVGAGLEQGGWSFALNMTKGRVEFGGKPLTPKPFTADDLSTHVMDKLNCLGLDDLTISDRLYVDGERIRDDPRFLPDRLGRPRAQLTPEELDDASYRSREVARRMYSVSVRAWDGEIVFTAFPNFQIKGSSLYVDTSYYALAPPRPAYRAIDSIDPRPSIGVRLGTVGEALLDTIKLPKSAYKTLRERRATWTAWKRRHRSEHAIARNPRFNYGARTSVRELAQAAYYRRRFQATDRDMFSKIVDREILDAILSFLEEHDVDTTEFTERQSAVLNNGVIVTGGHLTTQNMAVGQRAKAKQFRPNRRIR